MGQKISQFTQIVTLASGDYFPVIQTSGTTNKAVQVGVLDQRYFTLASGNQTQSTANSALASGNAALALAATAQASGNAALPRAGGTLTGLVTFSSGQVYPQIPANSQTTGYTLVVDDAGKHISITTGGVTIPSAVFAVGDVVSIYNNSGSDQTITQGTSVTLRKAGTATTGSRTLAQYGVATVLCVASNTFAITGAGLT